MLQHPFLQYAIQNWPHHISGSGNSDIDLFATLDDFMCTGNHDFDSWMDFRASLHSIQPEGFSPLHVAAYCGLTTYTKHLLELDGNPDCSDVVRRPPISYASEQGCSDVVQVLIKHSAQLNLVDGEGLAPIHYAARAGYHSALHHLLEAGVDPVTHRKKDDVHDVYIDNGHSEPLDNTALYYSCRYGHTRCVAERLRYVKPEFLAQGPLHWAVETGKAEVVSLLLQCEHVVRDARDMKGNTVLFVAARLGNSATVRVLLKHGVDVNERSENRNDRYSPTFLTSLKRSDRKRLGCTALHGWAGIDRSFFRGERNIEEFEKTGSLLIGCRVRC